MDSLARHAADPEHHPRLVFFGTNAYAAAGSGLIGAAFIFVTGMAYLTLAASPVAAAGEGAWHRPHQRTRAGGRYRAC